MGGTSLPDQGHGSAPPPCAMPGTPFTCCGVHCSVDDAPHSCANDGLKGKKHLKRNDSVPTLAQPSMGKALFRAYIEEKRVNDPWKQKEF